MMGVGEAMANIHRFAFGAGFVGVDEDEFGEDAAQHQCIGGGRADESGSDDDGF